jgi:RNA polymerase sigma-70 factor (ECF subfamily)
MLNFEIINDEDLVNFFLDGAPDEAESAFEALIMRHKPAVMNICRRVLDGHHDAEDAAQATFLALFRGAGRIRNRRTVGAWLSGVAYRVAIRMKARAARRRTIDARVVERVASGRAEDVAASGELRLILLEEIHALPEDLRTLVVHSYLEGRSNNEVARIHKCPIGTVKGRLWRARGMVRERLLSRVGNVVEVFA